MNSPFRIRNSKLNFILHPSSFILVFLLLASFLFLSCLDWSDSASPALSNDATDDDNTAGEEVWTDSTSGLMWQVTPTGGTMKWNSAKSHCQGLSLDGHNDWRLPTISELRSLIRGCDDTETGGDCGVTDECLDYGDCWNNTCQGCSSGGGPANGCYWPSQLGGSCSWYWSSSAVADYADLAWYVGFNVGHVNYRYDNYCARCVR